MALTVASVSVAGCLGIASRGTKGGYLEGRIVDEPADEEVVGSERIEPDSKFRELVEDTVEAYEDTGQETTKISLTPEEMRETKKRFEELESGYVKHEGYVVRIVLVERT